MKSVRRLARTITGTLSGPGREPAPAARPDDDGAWGGWQPPHPLDVDIRALSPGELRRAGQGRGETVHFADCPDGCGLIVWSDLRLPFNLASRADLEAWLAAG